MSLLRLSLLRPRGSGIKCLLLLGPAAISLVNPALAADNKLADNKFYVAAAPIGSDKADCSTPAQACATFQRAADLCRMGQSCSIFAAPGVYSQKTDVTYHRVVLISGSLDEKGHCTDSSVVAVDDRLKDSAESSAIFWAEDHAILTISCMTLRSFGREKVGFATRQFAIGDIVDVRFGTFGGGFGVSATETSKVNIVNPEITGSADAFAEASDLSQIDIGGTIRLADNVHFDTAFVSSLFGSIVSLHPSSIIGGKGSGAWYRCVDAIVKSDGASPAGDAVDSNRSGCGLAADTSAQFDGKLRAVETRLNNELWATQRNGMIAALALILAVCIAGAVAWRKNRHRKKQPTSS